MCVFVGSGIVYTGDRITNATVSIAIYNLYSQNPLQLVKFVYIQYEVLAFSYHFDFGSPRCLPNTWVCQMPSLVNAALWIMQTVAVVRMVLA